MPRSIEQQRPRRPPPLDICYGQQAVRICCNLQHFVPWFCGTMLPPSCSPLYRLGRPNRPFILMKTTSSYSSLAFAAFFKGKKKKKKRKKCQAAETGEVGGGVGEKTGYWILRTASCLGEGKGREPGRWNWTSCDMQMSYILSKHKDDVAVYEKYMTHVYLADTLRQPTADASFISAVWA